LVTNKWLVAIVDDELDIVNLFRDYLDGIKGIFVFTFTDPFIAFEHFVGNKYKYSLVISDLRMPGLSGLELIKKIKNENPRVRTLLMTAFEIDDPVFEEYRKTEVINDFLQKPVRFNDLRSMIEKNLNLYKNFKNMSKSHNHQDNIKSPKTDGRKREV
jgi:DNA-binding NtrC family response regulator